MAKDVSSILIIYNPTALKGKIGEFLPQIKQRLETRYTVVDYTTAKSAADMSALAEKSAPKYDVIVSCGGDGTLHQIINGIMKSEFRPYVGVLPFGTCNDVAHSLHIPNKMNQAIDCLLRMNFVEYDLMFDGLNYGIYAMATGYLTNCSYGASAKAKKNFGRMAYVGYAFKKLFKFKAIPLTVVADKQRLHGKFYYAMLMNGERAGGFKLNKGENLSNGKVKLVMIKQKNRFSSFISFIKLFAFGINSIRRSKNTIVLDVHQVQIENPSNEPFSFDGEKCKFLKKKITVNNSIKLICK